MLIQNKPIYFILLLNNSIYTIYYYQFYLIFYTSYQIIYNLQFKQQYDQKIVIIDHILRQVKARVNHERLITDKKKAKYIDEMAKQVNREQRKILLNALANKIRKEAKSQVVKN